ncbi:ATP-binding protein [Rhodoferax saidenbachensis]|uniref:Signal transduction histidine kinase n=1 Tax=Rhodoferax saidenbachensis TaxID=1484693 RepID=A0ABU1ZMN5_9BURK|nr:ATP-binding protein [Rhodoferax saidenbachensis]MDR7306743.1 signal transduction histidine kinase [Rhodoferax saidenbachensis]
MVSFSRRAPIPRLAVVWVACAVLMLALGVWWLYGAAHDARPAQNASIHLTRAEVLQQGQALESPAPTMVDSHALAGLWQPVALPFGHSSDLLDQADMTQPHGTRTTWYRLAVPDFEPGAAPLMLYTARTKAYGPIAVYVDGVRVTQWQLDGALWYWDPQLIAIDAGSRLTQPREILVRMQHSAQTHTALASVWLGPSAALKWRFEARQWLQLHTPAMSGGAFLAVGFFAFFIWARGKSAPGYGLFALLAVLSFVRALHFYVDVRVDDDWFSWLTVNSLFWLIAAVHFLQMLLHRKRQPWLTRSLLGLAAVVLLGTLPGVGGLPNSPQITPLIYPFAMLAGLTVTGVGIRLSWGCSLDGMLLAIGIGVSTLFGLNDWAIQSNFLDPESWYLGPYANLLNFMVFSYLMHRHYMNALLRVEHANHELAHKLRERENALTESYGRLRKIEHKQTVAHERQRLMQDMHDGLGSSLHSALRAIEKGQVTEVAVADILRGCIDDLHLTIDSMEPVDADLLLLLATLRYRLGPRLQTAGIALKWGVEDIPPVTWLDPRRALHVLRILQEALTNTFKHTEATEITVSTGQDGEGVFVCIADNGPGYDTAAALQSGGKGLANQGRRAQAIGARVSWASSPQGAVTTLWLPLLAPFADSRPAPL